MKYLCADCINMFKLEVKKDSLWYAMEKCILCEEKKLKVVKAKDVLND